MTTNPVLEINIFLLKKKIFFVLLSLLFAAYQKNEKEFKLTEILPNSTSSY